MNETSIRFLCRCFAPDETIALLLRRDSPAVPTQRVVTLETALAPRYRAWLAYENGTGANVYVAANPLHPGSRKRTKESIVSVRHLYIDIDTDGDARLAALRASDLVPPPTSILSTSRGKYQVLWRVEGFDFARQERMLKLLAVAFGGDLACTDCNRVLRVPGFLNRKYAPAHHVTVEYPDDSIWTPDDFRLDASAVNGMVYGNPIASRKPPSKHSNSESDWAWVSHQLAHGKDAVKLTRELASRRSDKPNPVYYAQRTVDVASARLWLIEGIRIDDVITMLEFRRRLEVPAALCSTRAREIAATAQRMTTRRKSA
ncbi:MAG: RepB family DNA primase [Acidobacteriaceae bacterium]